MSKRILICDDEEGIRESLKLILGDDYDLVVTESHEECLETFKKEDNIGLVLLDIKMPKQSGLDVLKELKEINPETKVIMVTGYKSVETASQAANLGADGYVVKPFEAEKILTTVERLI